MKAARIRFSLILFIGSLLAVSSLQANPLPPDATWFIDLSRFSGSGHGTMNCEACHGNMKEPGKVHPEAGDPRFLQREASRVYDYSRCQTCHRSGYKRTLVGVHAQALQKEKAEALAGTPVDPKKSPAPTCGNCHSSHYGKAHRSRLELGREMTATCGSCHPAQAASYLENSHGKKGVYLGKINSAYCTDCHGAHQCLSLKDRKVALSACQRCHPQARDQFATFVIHATTRDLTEKDRDKKSRVGVIQTVTLVMLVLVIALVVFFYGHSFIWLLRELHEKLKRRRP
jgi:Cytochrome c554 and c-prime